MEIREWISKEIQQSIMVKSTLAQKQLVVIEQMVRVIIERLRQRRKVILFGNGGSAADAQHIAAELVGRYRVEREALPAIALTTDTSILTAVGNDYGFEEIFARQIHALGEPGDIAIALSTSGNSSNVLRALEVARYKGLYTVGMGGEHGGKMKELVDVCLCVPSKHTPRIQEAHGLVGHIISGAVERAFLPEDPSGEMGV